MQCFLVNEDKIIDCNKNCCRCKEREDLSCGMSKVINRNSGLNLGKEGKSREY